MGGVKSGGCIEVIVGGMEMEGGVLKGERRRMGGEGGEGKWEGGEGRWESNGGWIAG